MKMSQGVTVVLNDKIMSKLRNLQAKKLRDSKGFVSFSGVLNEILEDGLKKK